MWTEKTNESESLVKCRKRRNVIKTGLLSLARDGAWGKPVYCPSGGRHQGGVSSVQALAENVGTRSPDVKGEPQAASHARGRVPKRGTGADQLVVVMKPGNAGGAKGLSDPAFGNESTRNGRSS